MILDDVGASNLFRRDPDQMINVGGADVAYRKVGTGPDVLFVHGWPVSGATFRKLLPHLVQHVTCHLIDLPGSGSSRFDDDSPLSVRGHVESVRRVVDALGLSNFSVVGHDSGGMIARHALGADPRVRAFGLIDTEMSTGSSFKFRMFLAGRHFPGYGHVLSWLIGEPRLRRNRLVLGDAFVDRSLIDGDFDEFFLRPISHSKKGRVAAMRILKSFSYSLVDDLREIHSQMNVPVVLVWGAQDRFFPVARATKMLGEFRDARLEVISDAGLFSHEERPAEVAKALLGTIAIPHESV